MSELVSQKQGSNVRDGIVGARPQAVWATVLRVKRGMVLEDDVVLPGDPVAGRLRMREHRRDGVILGRGSRRDRVWRLGERWPGQADIKQEENPGAHDEDSGETNYVCGNHFGRFRETTVAAGKH